MSQQVEGTWEEILGHANEFRGKRLRVTVIGEKEAALPNEAMLASLREIAAIQSGMSPTSGEDSESLLRKAREGGMYGIDSGR
jgi:hypothetical protein